ncbi:MAG: hypothetical protein V1859_08570 [archaeon]
MFGASTANAAPLKVDIYTVLMWYCIFGGELVIINALLESNIEHQYEMVKKKKGAFYCGPIPIGRGEARTITDVFTDDIITLRNFGEPNLINDIRVDVISPLLRGLDEESEGHRCNDSQRADETWFQALVRQSNCKIVSKPVKSKFGYRQLAIAANGLEQVKSIPGLDERFILAGREDGTLEVYYRVSSDFDEALARIRQKGIGLSHERLVDGPSPYAAKRIVTRESAQVLKMIQGTHCKYADIAVPYQRGFGWSNLQTCTRYGFVYYQDPFYCVSNDETQWIHNSSVFEVRDGNDKRWLIPNTFDGTTNWLRVFFSPKPKMLPCETVVAKKGDVFSYFGDAGGLENMAVIQIGQNCAGFISKRDVGVVYPQVEAAHFHYGWPE